jgi:hypothetical protein
MNLELLERKFRSRQNIMVAVDSAWAWVEKIGREAMDLLGEDDPICEQIDYACIAWMNAHSEISDLIENSSANKLEPKTLGQILNVLTRIKWEGPKSMYDLQSAYRTAVYNAGKDNDVHKNTIADGCCRRLQLNSDCFLQLVHEWLSGNPGPIKQVLKNHIKTTLHHIVDSYFDEGTSQVQ